MNLKSLLRSRMLLALLTLFFQVKTFACGYAYVSDCATTMKIEVNGAVSGFQVSTCPYLTVFQNHNFGTVTSLSITELKSQTWESCNNVVMNARFRYRIYPQSGSPGTFTTLNLTQLTTLANGPYRTKTRQENPNLNLLAGLNAGSYFIEIYLESDVDFNNDGTPDTQIKKDNGGNFYKASFVIPSGQSGSLTVALVNKTNVTCGGGNNGSATVSTTNGVSPFTYAWSNGAAGATVFNLAAGSYSVTSTDSEGSTGTLNVFITQPGTLLANLSSVNETSSSANNGSATAAPSGGTPPYTFAWTTGATTAAITNLDSGTYGLTVTDANGCTATSSVTIIVSGTTPTNYCASKGDFPWVDWITRVELNTIDNASSKNQYSNFTNLSTELSTGTNYTITLENGYSWQTYDEYWKAWIDYNRNGIFEEPGEIAFMAILNAPPLGSPGGTTTGTISIPATADEGATRMRISLKRGAYPTPCETIPNGEVEDYTVNLVNGGPVSCSISAFVSNIVCDDTSTNVDPTDDTYTFNLTVNGNGTGANWATSIGGQTYSGSYGSPVTAGPFNISSGALNFTVTDSNDSTCTASQSVTPPAPCSTTNPCAISANASTLICHDNGTPNDPADDTYTFNLTVTGSNTGTGWTTTVLGAPQSGAYATVTLMGPYPINAGSLNLTISDANDPGCTASISITPPSACSNGGGSVSYCASTSAFPWHDWIAGVAFENVDNPSSKLAYSDFTGLPANVTAGQSYPIDLTAGYSWYTYEEHWKVWIDYNQNGIFEEPDELAFSLTEPAPPNGTLELTVNGTIDIPATALAGPTRMRVAMKRDADPAPCETLPNGEVEDYTVSISAARPEGETGGRAVALQLNAVPDLDHIKVFAALEIPADAGAWELEKSNDNLNFEPYLSGNSGEHDYLVLQEDDAAPFEGENFYRLRLLDREGQVIGETTTSALFEQLASFTIFPNPTQGEFYLELSKLEGKEVFIEIFNAVGKPVFREIIPEAAGSLHRIEAEGWLDGMYFVVIRADGMRTKTRRLMVSKL